MRKLTLEFIPNEAMQEEMKPIFEIINSYEILESLKIDWEDGICVDLIEFNLKEGVSIHDLKFIGNMEILSILKSEDNKHTCLVKSHEPEETMDEYKKFDLDLIYSTPFIISTEKHTYSVIGDQKSLVRFIDLIKPRASEIINMSFKRAAYQKHDILTVLTDKQKEVLIAARKHGYYKYPRKIKSEDLAKKIGISKGTTVEHLRKAEERLIENILDGY
ncbi:MAG: helix-turn-helix domain-containing protein [Thermoplasmata archaeon]|nr:MAG: helix-turn-helix domain-containing protein [Thermoplasmata archaeon]